MAWPKTLCVQWGILEELPCVHIPCKQIYDGGLISNQSFIIKGQ